MPNFQIEEVIQALKRQIDELTEQQSRAMRSAIYIGMSRNEGAEYDERLNKIAELMRQLNALQEPVA
jgi:polyhydroxyalkanoate synthesis regulator phasin